jgi:hypothetical protein
MNSEITCPLAATSVNLVIATKFREAALRMSSRPIRTVIAFLRVITPKSPRLNRIEVRIRK